MPRGEIEPHPQERPLDDGRAHFIAHMAHDGARHLQNEAARFRERDEGRRRDDGSVRLAPAHQHLGAAHAAVRDIDDRLVIGNELAGLERLFQFRDRIDAGSRLGNRMKNANSATAMMPVKIKPERLQILIVGRENRTAHRTYRPSNRTSADVPVLDN